MGIDELRKFIDASPWTFARTMPEIPHGYSLRANTPDEKTFERVVLYIREAGYSAMFYDRAYTYLNIDGWRYWTMGAPAEETSLINRAKNEIPHDANHQPGEEL